MVQRAHVSVNNDTVQAVQQRAGFLIGTLDSPALLGTCQAQQELVLAKSMPDNTVNPPCSRALEKKMSELSVS